MFIIQSKIFISSIDMKYYESVLQYWLNSICGNKLTISFESNELNLLNLMAVDEVISIFDALRKLA